MPRRNRVDPWGDLQAVAARGLFTGNRGCLVDDDGRVVRHHAARAWITCRLEFRGRRHPLDAPRRWTPLFLLDDAVALAAGHRPCGECRRADHVAFRDAVSTASGAERPLRATEIDARLAAERLRRGRGMLRRGDRLITSSGWPDLPDGAVVVVDDEPWLVVGDALRRFRPDTWDDARPRPRSGTAQVLTPPLSVAALRHGFVPVLHPSAGQEP